MLQRLSLEFWMGLIFMKADWWELGNIRGTHSFSTVKSWPADLFLHLFVHLPEQRVPAASITEVSGMIPLYNLQFLVNSLYSWGFLENYFWLASFCFRSGLVTKIKKILGAITGGMCVVWFEICWCIHKKHISE